MGFRAARLTSWGRKVDAITEPRAMFFLQKALCPSVQQTILVSPVPPMLSCATYHICFEKSKSNNPLTHAEGSIHTCRKSMCSRNPSGRRGGTPLWFHKGVCGGNDALERFGRHLPGICQASSFASPPASVAQVEAKRFVTIPNRCVVDDCERALRKDQKWEELGRGVPRGERLALGWMGGPPQSRVYGPLPSPGIDRKLIGILREVAGGGPDQRGVRW